MSRNGLVRRYCEISRFTILHSGKLISNEGESVGCGEGVGIVLGPTMTQAWREAGAQWEAAWIVVVRLKLAQQGINRASSRINAPA